MRVKIGSARHFEQCAGAETTERLQVITGNSGRKMHLGFCAQCGRRVTVHNVANVYHRSRELRCRLCAVRPQSAGELDERHGKAA